MLRKEDYQAIVDLTCEYLGTEPAKVLVNSWRRGWYNFRSNVIELPNWLDEEPEFVGIYYAIHESCHTKHLEHNQKFLRIEDELLKLWDIQISRGPRAPWYPRTLFYKGEIKNWAM